MDVWVLLGKRITVQPDLDNSAAQLVFAKSLSVPGNLFGHPRAPPTNLQTKTLLEQLYKMTARPPVPTSTVVNPADLTETLQAKHVYVSRLINHLVFKPDLKASPTWFIC